MERKEAIKRAIRCKGITQKELAKRLGKNPQDITKFLNCSASIDRVAEWMGVLGYRVVLTDGEHEFIIGEK